MNRRFVFNSCSCAACCALHGVPTVGVPVRESRAPKPSATPPHKRYIRVDGSQVVYRVV